MSLFDIIFPKKGRERAVHAEQVFKGFNAYTPTFSSWNGRIYESDLVLAAADAKARHISKLKVDFRGSAKQQLKTIVRQKPNEFMTWSQFLYRLSMILDMNNTAFIAPMEDRFGQLRGFFPLLPAACEVVESKDGTRYLRYKFNNGQMGAIEMDRCGILTRHQYQNDFFGEENIALNPTMDLIHMQNQGIREGIKNGASFRFMGRLTNFRSPEDLKKERDQFTAENFRAGDGGFLLFPNTYDSLQQIKSEPYTIDAEQTKLIQTNVFNYFGVNEKVLQNSAVGDDLDAFYEGAIEPFAIQLAEVMSKMVYTDHERNIGNEVVVLANRLQYMTTSNKIAFVRDLGDRGYITINEARDLLNYAPLEGSEGDKRPARGEYYFIDSEGNTTQKDDDNEPIKTQKGDEQEGQANGSKNG